MQAQRQFDQEALEDHILRQEPKYGNWAKGYAVKSNHGNLTMSKQHLLPLTGLSHPNTYPHNNIHLHPERRDLRISRVEILPRDAEALCLQSGYKEKQKKVE